MEGLGNTACSLECACLNHVHGWTIWELRYLAAPRFLVASDRSQVARRRVRLDLVTSGSLNSNSTRAPNQLGSLCPVVMHSASDLVYSAYSWIGFFFPPSVPASKSNDWAYPIGSPFIAMYGVTDSCAKTLGSTVPVRQQVSGVLLRAHHSTI